MTIRNETVPLAAVRTDPVLRNIYGLAWNPWAPANTVSELAVVTAEIESEDGTRRVVALRPGAWYGGRSLMTRVWLTSPTPGNLVAEVGTAEGDFIVPSPAPRPSSQYKRELYVSAVAQAAGWTVESVNPGESTRLSVHVRSPNAAIVLGFGVYVADSDGVYRVTGGGPDGSVAAGGGSVSGYKALVRFGLPDVASLNLTDAQTTGKNANMAPSRIKFISTAAVDAAKQAVLEFVWAP